MTSFTNTWNASYESTPADSEDAALGASRIRELKSDVQERMEVDHSWAGDANDGAHKKLTMLEQGSNPTAAAGSGYLFTKDDSGITRLYFMRDDGTVIEIPAFAVGAMAYNSTSQGVTGSSAERLEMNTKLYDSGSIITLANNAAQVPSAGLWMAVVGVSFTNASSNVFVKIRTGTSLGAMTIPNGSMYTDANTGGSEDAFTAMAILNLSANDYVDALIRAEDNCNAQCTGFGVYKLGFSLPTP